jgi:purine-binding chemotaxis protein CheW
MAEKSQFCTFYLDELLFGAELHGVQEVIRCPEMTRIPKAPEIFRGLINLRGQIVTAIDLRRRLELEPLAEDATPMNVVVRCQDGTVSLLVDSIGDVVEVDQDTFEKPPENLSSAMRALIAGVHKLPTCLLHVLEVEKLVETADQPQHRKLTE